MEAMCSCLTFVYVLMSQPVIDEANDTWSQRNFIIFGAEEFDLTNLKQAWGAENAW